MNKTQITPSPTTNRFYGKYRGTVIQNIDPEQIGRVLLQVPSVLGEKPSGWAMPCVPVAGLQSGCFMVPPIGSQVWVEFEEGNPDYPIWAGGFWGTVANVPTAASTSPIPPGQNIILQTTGQNMIAISDAQPTTVAGGIVLKSAGGAMIVINETGIYIANGQGASITLVGPAVTIHPSIP
jgi:uncharacterized protein involved in type VI secretion and phage assembly